jgi:hypothetical protein
MAQRKKSVATRRRKTAKARKSPKRMKAAQRKVAKRSVAKVKARPAPANAKTKRPAAKTPTSKKAVLRKQQGEPPIEVVKVETVGEPVPGVVVVTEYESVRVRRPRPTVEPDKPKESAGIPESNGK